MRHRLLLRPITAQALVLAFLFLLVPLQVGTWLDGAGVAHARASTLRQIINRHAVRHGVPIELAHAVVMLESRYRARIVHKGNYGLMQIRLGTARSLGFRGTGRQLLQPAINLHYGMAYLGRAWRASGGNVCRTIQRYQTGRSSRYMLGATKKYCTRANRIIKRLKRRTVTSR